MLCSELPFLRNLDPNPVAAMDSVLCYSGSRHCGISSTTEIPDTDTSLGLSGRFDEFILPSRLEGPISTLLRGLPLHFLVFTDGH